MEVRNRESVLTVLRDNPQWRTLDLGAWEQPVLLAEYAIDRYPFESSGPQGVIGELDENRLSPDRWIQMDMELVEFPFDLKFFDFVICSNVLEDLSSPYNVLLEINRVGKAGYVEIPRIGQELTRGVDESNPGQRGYWHHRWFIDYDGDTLIFLPKLSCLDVMDEIEIPDETRGFEPIFWDGVLSAEFIVTHSRNEYFDAIKEMLYE